MANYLIKYKIVQSLNFRYLNSLTIMIKITRYIYYIIQKLIVRLAFDKSIVSNI